MERTGRDAICDTNPKSQKALRVTIKRLSVKYTSLIPYTLTDYRMSWGSEQEATNIPFVLFTYM